MVLRIVLLFAFIPVAVLVGRYLSRIYERLLRICDHCNNSPPTAMKSIISWCGILLFVSVMVWLFLDSEKARPILKHVFPVFLMAVIACFCFIMSYRGSVNLPKGIKELKETNEFKDKIWQSFSILFGLLLFILAVGGAGGSLIMIYDYLKASFQ